MRVAIALLAGLAGAVSPAWGYNPAAGDYTRAVATDIRILSWNTLGQFIADPATDTVYDRLLQTLNPDLICLQEIPDSVSISALVNRLNATLPIPGDTWKVHEGIGFGVHNVLASRYSLSLKRTNTTPVAGTRGVTMALVDLPNLNYTTDLYLMGVHLKCCGAASDELDRQQSADAIAAWIGDCRTAGGNINLAAGTPIIVLGDFNLVLTEQPAVTIKTGNIQDEATFGPDIKGDWDISDLTDLGPKDPFTNDLDTWPTSGSQPTDRLDRFFYTDSVVTIAHSFVLNTKSMTTTARNNAGLLQSDSADASDHLPIVMDLRFIPFVDCNGNGVNDPDDILNGTSTDCNANQVPDDCETDTDGDGVIDVCDNCPNLFNPDQADFNQDGVGDLCKEPGLLSFASRKVHGGAGAFNIFGSTECRSGGLTELVATFDEPIQGIGGLDNDDVLVTLGSVAGLAIQNNVLTIQLSGAGGNGVLQAAFPGIGDLQQNPTNDIGCILGLLGDTSGDRSVNIFDLLAVRAQLNQPVGPTNFRHDVIASGGINIFDLLSVRAALNTTMSPCP